MGHVQSEEGRKQREEELGPDRERGVAEVEVEDEHDRETEHDRDAINLDNTPEKKVGKKTFKTKRTNRYPEPDEHREERIEHARS